MLAPVGEAMKAIVAAESYSVAVSVHRHR